MCLQELRTHLLMNHLGNWFFKGLTRRQMRGLLQFQVTHAIAVQCRPGLAACRLHLTAIPRSASALAASTRTSTPWETPLLDGNWTFRYDGSFEEEGIGYSRELLVKARDLVRKATLQVVSCFEPSSLKLEDNRLVETIGIPINVILFVCRLTG